MIPLSPVSLRFPTLEHSLLPEDQEQWRKRTGLLLYEVYGQSETGGNHRQPGAGPRSSFLDAHVDSTQGVSCVTLRGMKIKPGSIGKGIPSFDVQIIDDKGNSLPFNTEGNIGIRMKPTKPIGLFMGYEDNPVKTAKVECGDFYNSGDRATMDEEGYIWFLGRNDDIINASGLYTWLPLPLSLHSGSALQVVKAFIVLTPEFLSHDRDQLTKELQQHVKSVPAPSQLWTQAWTPQLPEGKQPRVTELVSSTAGSHTLGSRPCFQGPRRAS
ncbi:acyl-coenzyme A synthetase ACSM1, mitochondrial-like isoform X2 [Mirounga angustirostris]|uniref:acyl-coenzyme A synthetase ACSM1, mitochondrial-like isoform X2 n=1 Tax=Mirounga angustirostris TaxID=9716 RepID=UPI00313E3AB0